MTDGGTADEGNFADEADGPVSEGDYIEEPSGNRIRGGMAAELLTYMVSAVVADPESVVVDTKETRGGVELRLSVAPMDMGRVIGRRGRVINALRTLSRVAGAREDVEVSVEVLG